MRILHTSDWHIGRTFFKFSTLESLARVFDAMVTIVEEEAVDVVAVPGDVFDAVSPTAECFDLLDDTLLRLSAAGATIVMTSGNHDSPSRLGAKSAFTVRHGIHLMTRPERLSEPVTIPDEDGDVQFYGIPFLHPARQRAMWDVTPMNSQKDALAYAMDLIRTDLASRGGRSVVLAHTFVQGAEGESCDSERDIVVGGVDMVPTSVFSGIDYVALGHIHGRQQVSNAIRYAGAPLHYSFSEAAKPRGGWLVDLAADGSVAAEWRDFPVPVPLKTLTGHLQDLLHDPAFAAFEDHWTQMILTDPIRPREALAQVQVRFPRCVALRHEPAGALPDGHAGYATLVKGKTDLQVTQAFLAKVRHGVEATHAESDLVRETIEALRVGEMTA